MYVQILVSANLLQPVYMIILIWCIRKKALERMTHAAAAALVNPTAIQLDI
jgi:hypothetical protein